MRRIFSWFSFQKILLFILLGFLIFKSRLSGSEWLLGWDSVMPELDWKLNFSRVLAGAWQEYQGVGLTGGMAHLADLSRMVILWILNLFVPTQYVRWIWHMGMLVLGPLGVWYIGKKLWKWNESACLTASVFYLLNLATVQYFFVPYEAFSSFYGFLPWLIAVFFSYLESGKINDLKKIMVMGIVATSAFYVQTLFVVYIMVLGFLSLGYLRNWKRILIGFLTLFILNSFWLLPVMYGVLHGGGLVGLAKINSIGSPETALMNEGFGSWQNVMLLKGYWLEYIENIGGTQWGRLMQVWWDFSNQSYVAIVGTALFGVSTLGLFFNGLKKKLHFTWIIGLIFSFAMIASFNKPFGFIYRWLVENVPLFGEMFRSVFTKWSVVLALFVSIGLGSVVAMMKNKWIVGIFTSLMVVSCIAIVSPVFKVGLIFDKMKVELPSEYLKMFEFMKSQPTDSRVAYLPAQDIWSWKYADWGYRGSGYLWYGIEQPMLDRAFDVWSPYNEGFYNEFSTALYGENIDKVAKVLNKYDVRYVLLDESVSAPGQGKEILRIEETKKLAEELGWQQKFQEGFLSVWEVVSYPVIGSSSNPVNSFISAPSEYSFVEADTSKVRQDIVFDQVGTYVSNAKEDEVTYPFANLMREEVTGVEYEEGKITLSSDLSFAPLQTAERSELLVPGWKVGDIVRIQYKDATSSSTSLGTQWEPLPAYYVNGQSGPIFLGKEKPEVDKDIIYAKVSEGKEWSAYLKEQRFELLDSNLKIEVPTLPRIYDFGTMGQGKLGNCDVLKRGVAEKITNPKFSNSQIDLQETRFIADGRGAACDYIEMTEIDPRMSYLMRFQGNNIEGRSLKYFLYNTGSMRNDIEYLLGKKKYDQTFSLLSWQRDGYYTLNIETRSFGQRAENLVQPVEVRWFPLEQIAGAKIILNQKFSNSPIGNELQIKSVKKNGTWLYRVKVEGSGLLKLSQGYDQGWISPGLIHVKVDGWANGWIIPQSGEATIFYWPQLLEYLGFLILGGTIIFLLFKRK